MLGDLNGFVEHLEEYRIAGKIYAAKALDKVFQIMREWGKQIFITMNLEDTRNDRKRKNAKRQVV